ncbi:MAG: NUDIX domain-containing protein [Parachlamydiales bacterium]|nr:NUDIX domain-containing protein [Parachlamydiales bacterium]
MKSDFSFGIVPLKKENNQWHVFIIKHSKSYWGLPKGHAENEETPQQAAARELKEETGLSVDHFMDCPPLVESYTFYYAGEQIHKTVTYFMALVSGYISLQEDEVEEGRWVLLEQASSCISYPESQAVISKTLTLINNLN